MSQQLLAAGEHVVDVPPTLSARVRLLGSTKAAKNDDNDALSTAIAGLRHCELRVVRRDDHTTVLRLLVGRYDDLVALRTPAACRLHALLRELVAGGTGRRIKADRAADVLRGVRPNDPVTATRKRLAGELLGDIRRLDHELAAIKHQINDAVAASAPAPAVSAARATSGMSAVLGVSLTQSGRRVASRRCRVTFSVASA